MRIPKILLLLILCTASVRGMEDESPPPPRKRLGFLASMWKLTDGVQDFGDAMQDVVEEFPKAFPKAVDEAVKKGFDQMADALKPGG